MKWKIKNKQVYYSDWFEQCYLNRSLLQHFELFTILMSSTLTVFSSLGLSGDDAQGSHFRGSIERLMCFGRWGEGFFGGPTLNWSCYCFVLKKCRVIQPSFPVNILKPKKNHQIWQDYCILCPFQSRHDICCTRAGSERQNESTDKIKNLRADFFK